jgi:hypothetical protein
MEQEDNNNPGKRQRFYKLIRKKYKKIMNAISNPVSKKELIRVLNV